MANDIYSAIYSVPEAEIFNEFSCDRWVLSETSFGTGLAMHAEGFTEDSFRLARANSFWNRGNDNYIPFERYWADDIDFSCKTVGVVGNMKGIRKRYSDLASDIFIFDFIPEDGVLPAEMEDEILPLCDIVSISGSAIQNGTLPHLLELCRNAYVCVVGPSVPQCRELFDFGIDRISGMCVTDTPALIQHIEKNADGTPYVFGAPFLLCR